MTAATCEQPAADDTDAPGADAPAEDGAARLSDATVVYARLHHFSTICACLAPEQAAAFVNEARRVLSEPVLKLGGQIAQRRPDSVLAVFSNAPGARKPDHAQRALHAAILAVHETVQLAAHIVASLGGQRVPTLTLAAGVHVGLAGIGRRGRPGGLVRVSGEVAEIARLLEVTAGDLRWSIAASERTIVAAAGRVEGGRIGSVAPPDNSFIDVVEVTALVPRKASTTAPEMYGLLRHAIARNARAWEPPHDMDLRSATGWPPQQKLLIEGYRIARQIGAGGMATVFLAQPQEPGPPQVLKMLRIDTLGEDDTLQRFIQEFALLVQVRHPNVARIVRQDFSAGHAYIVMEYFPGGDLRARIGQGLSCEQAMDYVKQTARGLAAIHAQGIVHRDLKPDNLMLRQDGSLALADFGIAKQVSMRMMDTGHGDIVGTPSYLSPEQAKGEPVDARCDLYSLGVLMFELLTGRRPYTAETADAMLDLHIHAHVPTLRNEFRDLQPVLNRLMAKNRDQRYASAQALLDDLQERGL